MTLIPIAFNDLLNDFHFPTSLFDQNFGLGFQPEDLINPDSFVSIPLSRRYFRPWRHIHRKDSGVSNIATTDTEFKVNLDVQQFQPEDLNVKVVDNAVIINGKHEERKDEHGYISRQFTRRYVLPDTVDPAAVVSSLSSDGVLTVSAPKKTAPLPENERVVPIVQTKQPAINNKAAVNAGGDSEKMEQ